MKIKDLKKIDINRCIIVLRTLKTSEFPAFAWIIKRAKKRIHPLRQYLDFLKTFYDQII